MIASKTSQRVGIYSPYLDTAGGGEKYILTIAEILSKDNDVDIFLDKNLQRIGKDKLRQVNESRHDLDLSKVKFISAPFGEGGAFKKAAFLKKYDLVIYLTDGSLFYSTAKRNILHIQSPIINNRLNSPLNKFKLSSWNLIIYNSEFTKYNSQKYWKLPAKVVYPPVNVDKIKPLKKNKYILNVGRFFGYLKPKKQEEMINAFKVLIDNGKAKGWEFHLAGGVEGGDEYLNSLKKNSKGYPVIFHPNISFRELVKLYGESSIYWHAAGLGEDDPTKMEHFGITTVEAMAAGCVPIVINKGGQKEIVEDRKSGFLWNTLEELQDRSIELINARELMSKMSMNAQQRSEDFNKNRFEKEIIDLTNER